MKKDNKIGKLIIINPNSIDQCEYFCEDGTFTRDITKAHTVWTIKEGDEFARKYTMYEPTYKDYSPNLK